MKIAFISDTHTYHENIQIPDCDILIHCGDISIYGEIFEVKNFLQWFGNQKARHKIFICGNHEVVVGNMNGYVKKMVEDHNKYYMSNIVYLEETGVEVEGLKLWGSPYTPEFFNWQYMYKRADGERRWLGIPDDVDVLITHGPPYGVLDDVKPFSQYQDDHAGCAALLDKIKEVKPKVHAFGHIHQHYGTKRLANSVFIETLFINASTCNSRYVPVNPPIVVDTETWSLDESNI